MNYQDLGVGCEREQKKKRIKLTEVTYTWGRLTNVLTEKLKSKMLFNSLDLNRKYKICWKVLSLTKKALSKNSYLIIWLDFGKWIRLRTFQHPLIFLCVNNTSYLFWQINLVVCYIIVLLQYFCPTSPKLFCV